MLILLSLKDITKTASGSFTPDGMRSVKMTEPGPGAFSGLKD
jgi:hypothetical protein